MASASSNPLDDLPPPNPLDALPPPGANATSTPYDITASVDPTFAAAHPVTGELGVGLQNAAIGAGSFLTDIPLRMRQLYGAITGGPSLAPEVQAKQALDAPISQTYGGMAGRAAVPAIASAGLGGTSIPANALIGLITGASKLTNADDPSGTLRQTAINAGIGVAAGAAGAAGGNKLAGWAAERAEYPIAGHTLGNLNTQLARAVGSQAPKLGQPELAQRAQELGNIYSAGRNAATAIDLSPTPAAIDAITSELNPSVRPLVENNPNVQDLISHATGSGTVNGQMLGRISTGLRQDASAALNSEGGNREAGLALQQLRNHVEERITSHIADPELQASYAAAGPQYGLLQDVRYNPSLLNAGSGEAQGVALARYAQRNLPNYTTENAMDNPLFNALTWAQRGGGAKGAPDLNLISPWKPAFYYATHNPVARYGGGLASRAVELSGPTIPRGLSALGSGAPVLLPDLEH